MPQKIMLYASLAIAVCMLVFILSEDLNLSQLVFASLSCLSMLLLGLSKLWDAWKESNK